MRAASLLRPPTFLLPASRIQSYPVLSRGLKRKSKGSVKAAMRQKRRLKNMNLYDPSYTKEKISSFHDIPDRFRLLLDFYQELRNNTRLTRKPIPPEEIKQYATRSKAYQERNHFKFLKETELQARAIQNVWNTLEHAATLPPEAMLECFADPENLDQKNAEYDVQYLYGQQIKNLQPLEESAPMYFRNMLQDAQVSDTASSGKKRK